MSADHVRKRRWRAELVQIAPLLTDGGPDPEQPAIRLLAELVGDVPERHTGRRIEIEMPIGAAANLVNASDAVSALVDASRELDAETREALEDWPEPPPCDDELVRKAIGLAPILFPDFGFGAALAVSLHAALRTRTALIKMGARFAEPEGGDPTRWPLEVTSERLLAMARAVGKLDDREPVL